MLRFKCLVLFSWAVLLQLPLSVPVEAQRNETAAVLGGLGAGLQEWGRQRDIRRRRELQEAALAQEQRMLQQQLDAQRAASETERRRLEAAFRLFWSRARDVVEGIQDTYLMAGKDSRKFLQDAEAVLQDVFLANPLASTGEIRENLQPLVSDYARRDSTFAQIVSLWAQSLPRPQVAYDSLEAHVLGLVMSEAKGDFMIVPPSAESRAQLIATLQEAIDAVLVNRVACYGEVAREPFTPSLTAFPLKPCIEELRIPHLTAEFQRLRNRR